MSEADAKAQIDFWWETYERGHITAEQRDNHIECVALLYRLRRDYNRYSVLSR